MLFSCLFECFEEKEYQTESKRNETFENVIFSSDKIQETWTLHEVLTRVGAHLPSGRAALTRGRLVASLTSTPSLLDHNLSKNHAVEGFIPFGLRLIFLFFEILKYTKKQQYGLGLRLVG